MAFSPALPSPNDPSTEGIWGTTLNESLTGLEGRVTATETDLGTLETTVSNLTLSQPGGVDGYPGGVFLEDFSGANDDARLGNAMAYAGSQTRKPAILMYENRNYGPFTTVREMYQGFKLIGPPGFASMVRSANSTPHRIQVQTNGGWLRIPRGGNLFDVCIQGLSFDSMSSTCDFLANATGGGNKGVLWTSVIRDCAFNLFRHVLGTPSESLGMTANTFSGYWNVNNSRGVAIHIGGSDNNLWTEGMLLDTPTSISSSGNVPYHLWLDFMEKSNVGPLFVTAEGVPAGIRVTGSNSRGPLQFNDVRVEGRNTSSPSLGAVILLEGNQTIWNSPWIAYAMANPSGATGHTGNLGYVHITGGRHKFICPAFGRTSSVSETAAPFIHATGSSTRVDIAWADVNQSTSYSGLPRTRAASGATVVDITSSTTAL